MQLCLGTAFQTPHNNVPLWLRQPEQYVFSVLKLLTGKILCQRFQERSKLLYSTFRVGIDQHPIRWIQRQRFKAQSLTELIA
ncbi:MAG: hypothetical protein DMG65_00765 [Candidatus Angelobacter sp. Gp1-AA117]|nr:MAG: hypothetical protein DMG65_00765 [Candidatus Angelobacter sp. Gp1-AA117]